MLVIDNIERPLQSDALCTAITEPIFTDRLLGQSRTVTVETNTLFAATGNNLQLAGDLSARAVLCQLDPEVERPEQREFRSTCTSGCRRIVANSPQRRMTIIKAYLAAGEPKPAVPNFARFEDWQQLCRYPLVWLGLDDPCTTRENIEAADPVRETLRGCWPPGISNSATAGPRSRPQSMPGQNHPSFKARWSRSRARRAASILGAWVGSSPGTSAGSKVDCDF